MSALTFAGLIAGANALLIGAHFAARHARAAETARQAEAEQQARRGAIGLEEIVLLRTQQYAKAEAPLVVRRGHHARISESLANFAAKLRRQLWRGGEWSMGFTLVVVVLALAWLFVFLLLRSLDIRMLEALGYVGASEGLAMILGTLIALVFTVIGIVIAGLLDLHPLLPRAVQVSQTVKRILIANFTAIAIGLALWLPNVAVFRSQNSLGPMVTTQQEVLAQAQQDGNPTAVQVAEIKLANAQQRLKAGESVDRTLAIAAPLLELAIAWAPVYALELLVLGGTGVLIRRHQRRRQLADDQITRLNLDWTERLTQELIDRGHSAEEVLRVIRRPPDPLPAPGAGGPTSGGDARHEQDASAEGPQGDGDLPGDVPPDEVPGGGPTGRPPSGTGSGGQAAAPGADEWDLVA